MKEQIENLKWKHNKNPETKAIAGTLARYGYEELVREHNEEIDKAVELGKQEGYQLGLKQKLRSYNENKK
jgi:hypothetical protein